MTSLLEDVFELLELAGKLEESDKNRIEAATKYYEATYLMRLYIQRLPNTEVETKQLLEEKVSFYNSKTSTLMADDSSTVVVSYSPRSPLDSVSMFPDPPHPPSTTHLKRDRSISTLASHANEKLSQALDLDEKGKTERAIAMYMEAAEMYLQAIPRVKNETSELANVLKRRLEQTLDRVEVLKQPKGYTVFVQPKSRATQQTTGSLTPAEIEVLKRSSLIASGLFLPWSDDDGVALREGALSPKTILYRDPKGFLPLNSKQHSRFYKWARPTEIVKLRQERGRSIGTQRIVLIDNISPYSIRQQFITDCSFIASLCGGAAFERRFKKKLITSLIYPQSQNGVPMLNAEGRYIVKLWLNGVARAVDIDDFLPVDKYGNLLCSCTTNPSCLELWVPLIEKAYMKLCGGYDFPGSNSGVDLFSLTGWIPERIMFAEDPADVRDHETAPERAWDRIVSASSYGDCLITVSTTPSLAPDEIQGSGLVTGHAYAVLSVIETKNGTRLLQLKNPWAQQSWKGKYSSGDEVGWSDLAFCAEVGYNPQLARQQDDGVFFIDWNDILKYFQNLHLSWNPTLFQHRLTTHDYWPKDRGPANDSFNIGDNPQYILALSEEAIRNRATIWILVSRHVTKQEQEGSEIKDFLTVHVHRNDSKRRVIWYPGRNGGCVLTGAYTNNPHVLVRYDTSGPEDAYLSLVLSQYNKTNDLGYTLSCFCTSPFHLGRPLQELDFRLERTSAWTEALSGGALGTPNFESNPSFAMFVPGGGVEVEIRVSTMKTSAVNVVVVPVDVFGHGPRQATGKPLIDSGKYRYGFLATERTKLAGGSYVILVSSFEEGQVGKFFLVVQSSVPVKVQEISCRT